MSLSEEISIHKQNGMICHNFGKQRIAVSVFILFFAELCLTETHCSRYYHFSLLEGGIKMRSMMMRMPMMCVIDDPVLFGLR